MIDKYEILHKSSEVIAVGQDVGFGSDQKLIVTETKAISKEYEHRPYYKMVGIGTKKQFYGVKQMDALTILEDMNPKSAEMKAWKHIKNILDEKNIAIIKLSQQDKRSWFYAGIKKLVEKDIVVKVSTGIYMVNPTFIIPAKSVTAAKEYLRLKKGKVK